ncbi:NUDIX hydrolase [Kitasatospora sp. NPDC058218]|uniref:NUDIX hydrolase n=1 Tax=Kitasatospora sp. NPDC058218 TaxID=3346385 RepID=UPI0036DEC812
MANGEEEETAMRLYTIVAAVLRRDAEVALVAHRGDAGELVWSLPAGKVEPYEAMAEAAAREIAEETGLALRELGALAYAVQYSRPQLGDSTLAFVFEAETEGDPKVRDPDGEVVAVEFVPVAEAIARLERLPSRVMAEPAITYLSGGNPSGTFLSYRDHEGTPALLTRTPAGGTA